MDGQAIGTPGYMAPEQANGQVAIMDERSDTYSLGAILYHILALEPTFRGDSKTSKEELLKMISEGQIAPLKETRRIPLSLIVVAMKALSLKPEDRYPTVTAFQTDLEAYLNGFATSAERLSVWRLATLFVRRHKVVSAATMIILILQSVALSINIRERSKAEHAEKTAVREKIRAVNSEKTARKALSELKAAAPALAVLSDAHLQHREMERALKIISDATELAPENAEYHKKRANLLQTLYRFKEAAEEYAKALEITPGDKSTAENLEICRGIKPDTQKLFLALRQQNRVPEALQVIMPLTKKPEALTLFLKKILETENTVYKSLEVDREGKCVIELDSSANPSALNAFPTTDLIARNSQQLSDLSTIKDLPLTSLDLEGCKKISDLSPLKGLPLTTLNLSWGPDVSDLVPLKGMPLTRLYIGGCRRISDLTPLKGIPLTALTLSGCQNISDLSPLKGMPLTALNLAWCPNISDLTPLKAAPLTTLNVEWCQNIQDLSPLKGMPLTSLNMRGCQKITDLSPLTGMPLISLQLEECKTISDLSPLKDMPLTWLTLKGCINISDLSPLKALPLHSLEIDLPLLAKEKEIVIGLKALEIINGTPSYEFWKQFGGDRPATPYDIFLNLPNSPVQN